MPSLNFRPVSPLIRVATLLFILIAPSLARAQWHATVGAQSPQKGRQALAFFPNELWIHEGDSIAWKFEASEIHTVTFLATQPTAQVRPPFQAFCPSSDPSTFDGSACVSTPPLVEGSTFTVTFPTPGNYKLVCLVHPDMTGVVHVLERSMPLPHLQDFYDDEAEAQRHVLLSDADRDEDEAKPAHHHVS